MKKLKKLIASSLAVTIMFQMTTSISLKPEEIMAGDAAGSSQGVSFGRSSNGNVQVANDTLLRVAGFMEEGPQWEAGYEQIYPANGSFAVMVGSGGNGHKTNTVLATSSNHDGQVIYQVANNVYYDDTRRGSKQDKYASIIHRLFKMGSGSYIGDLDAWTGRKDLVAQWTDIITVDDLKAAGLPAKEADKLIELTQGYCRLTFDKFYDIDCNDGEKAQIRVAAYIIAAAMKERGGTVTLDDVYRTFITDKTNNGKKYVVTLENMYCIKEQGEEWAYVLPYSLVGAAAGYSLSIYQKGGNTWNVLNNALTGLQESSANGVFGARIVERGSSLRQSVNQMYSPALFGNAKARQMWYWRAERTIRDPVTGEDIPVYQANFADGKTAGFTDMRKAIWNLNIIQCFDSGVSGEDSQPKPGNHLLSSVPEFISTEADKEVSADQFINFKQDPLKIPDMLTYFKKAYDSVNVDDLDNYSYLEIEYIGYEVDISGGLYQSFSMDPETMRCPIDKKIPIYVRAGSEYEKRPWQEVEQQIIYILNNLETDFKVSKTIGKFPFKESGGTYEWNYNSKAEIIWSMTGADRSQIVPIDLDVSTARTIIEVKPGPPKLLRWYNQPVAFAEVKEGTYSDDRSTEKWEVMDGTPTTETLYINAGGTPVFVDIVAKVMPFSWTRKYVATDHHSCQGGHSEGRNCGGSTDTKSEVVTHKGSTVSIERVNIRTADKAILENIEIFKDEKVEIPINGTVTFSNNSSKIFNTGKGSPDTNAYGSNDKGLDHRSKSYNTGGSCGGASGSEAMSTLKGEDAVIKAFAQSDKISVRIEGVVYDIMENVKIESDVTRDSYLAVPESVFKPIAEKWDITTKIPVIGYNGHPTALGARNNTSPAIAEKKRFYKTGIQPLLYQVNGLYHFNELQMKNIMEYSSTMHTLIGKTANTYTDNEPVTLQYTDWKMGSATHTEDVTKYKGPNPIVFHDPVSAQNVWIHDTPDSILKDQRIKKGGEFDQKIETHDNVTNVNAPSRQYIDFDFKITFGNSGSFGKDYAGNQAVNEKGILNVNEAAPGTRAGGSGWGFYGDFNTKLSSLPRSAPLPTLPNTGMDTSKWINAKYVRFNGANVRYSKDNSYHPSGTWIKLYDDGFVPKTGDETEFIFRITSDVRDAANVTYDYISEAINIPESIKKLTDVQARANALYTDSESKPVNSARGNFGYASINGNITTVSARHSAKNMTRSDVIGRIGNVIVDDSNDPAWASTFWKPGKAWLIEKIMKYPDTETPVSKYFSIPYGLFEEKDTSRSSFNNRWSGLSRYHDSSNIRLGQLPVMRGSNVETFYKHTTIKMGYDIQFSVQTLGDYDSQMSVVPSYELGDGFPNTPNGFSFYAPSPDEKGNVFMKQFYNSETTNPYNYEPTYRYLLSHTLKSSRAKINEYEKSTPEYKSATKTNSVKLGTPSLITIPKALRTYIGSPYTAGNVSVLGEGGERQGSENVGATYTNAQRWHGRIGLPSSTVVSLNSSSNSSLEKLNIVKKTHAQYIIVYLTFRTQGSSAPWDLTTRTNSPSNPSTDSQGNPEYSFTIPPGAYNNPPREDVPKDTKDDPYKKPRIPVVVLDYSFDSSTDSSVVGTH